MAQQAAGMMASRSLTHTGLVILIAPGLFLQGFDSPIGQTVVCLVASGVLATLLLAERPQYAFWQRYGPKLLVPLLAMAWLLAVAGFRLAAMDTSGLPFAPDLFVPKFLATLAGLWALAIGLICARASDGRMAPSDWILLAVTLHTLAGLVQFGLLLAGLSDDWDVMYRNRFAGLIGNANVTACVCGTACVLAWGNMLASFNRPPGGGGAASPGHAIPSMLALAINVPALVLTASRVPAVVTLAAMILLLVLLTRRRASFARLLPAVVLSGIAVMLVQSQFAAELVDRMGLVGSDMESRWMMWTHYAQSVPAAVWTGYGPGSFSSLNIFTMPPEGGRYELWSVNSSHNLIVQLLLVGGVPYFALLALAAILVARDIFRSALWRHRDDRFVTLALAACIIPIAGAVDIALDIPASTLLFAVLTGLAWGMSTPEPTREKRH